MYEKMIYEIEDYGDLKEKTLYLCSSGSSHVIDLILTGEHIKCLYHSGDCDEDIARHMELPEIKKQFDLITDEKLGCWWNEFFCDDTPQEHIDATRERRLGWLLFDAAANAIDGYCYEYSPEKWWYVQKEVDFDDGTIITTEPCNSEETAQEVAKFMFGEFLTHQNEIAKKYNTDFDWEIGCDSPNRHFAHNGYNESILVEVNAKTQITEEVFEYFKLGLLPM